MRETDHKALTIQLLENLIQSWSTFSHPVLSCHDSFVSSTLTCSPPISHLSSEDTDAVHPHQSDWQTFNKTFSSLNFPVPPLSFLLLLVTSFCLLSVSVSPPHPLLSSLNLSLLLLSCPLHLSFQRTVRAVREDLSTKIEADSETWQLSWCTSTRPLVFQLLSSFYGSW